MMYQQLVDYYNDWASVERAEIENPGCTGFPLDIARGAVLALGMFKMRNEAKNGVVMNEK